MISVKNVSLTIKNNKLLDDISLEVSEGEAVGIVGGNGSGKTVLMKCMLGFFANFDGEIVVNDERIVKDIEFAENTGFIIETPGFMPNMSGYENLKVLAGVNKIAGNNEIREYMKLVGLDPDSKKKVRKYSLGMKQKLALAQAMMEKPRVLILDEPFNGLDKGMVEKMRRVLQDEKNRGTAIFMASHNEKDIESLCDRVYEIDNGKLM